MRNERIMKTIAMGMISCFSRIKVGCRMEQLGFVALSTSLDNLFCNLDQ